MSQIPTIGGVVHYTLSAQDVERIRSRRGTGAAATEMGTDVVEGQTYPALVVRNDAAPEHGVNLQVALDGYDTLWVTFARPGDVPGTWHWPERV